MDSENLRFVAGKKQILRLLKENELKSVRIATDADAEYVQSIVAVARAHNVSVVYSSTMQEIAVEHGIEVPCGAVGYLKDAE